MSLNFAMETNLSKSKCCECGRELDACSGPCRPGPGDFTLCAYCGCLNVFDKNLDLRPPTSEEVLLTARNSDFQMVRRIIERVATKKGKK